MSLSSDLLSARSAAGVGVDVEGTSGAVPVATLWIGAVVKTENSNEGTPVSSKPVMDTSDNPSDETLCGAALHRSSRRNLCVHPGIQIVHSCPQGSDFSRQSVRQRDNGRLDRSTQLLQLSGREANTDLTR